MKVIKLIIVLTLLTVLVTGCQIHLNENTTSESDVLEVKKKEEELAVFFKSYLESLMNDDKEFASTCIESREDGITSDDAFEERYARIFHSDYEKVEEIYVKNYESLKKYGEEYVLVNYWYKFITDDGKVISGRSTELLYEKNDTFVILNNFCIGAKNSFLGIQLISYVHQLK